MAGKTGEGRKIKGRNISGRRTSVLNRGGLLKLRMKSAG